MNLTRAWKSTVAFFAIVMMTVAWGGGNQENTLTAIGNKTTCPGDTVIFTTTAGGPTPYKFTWQKNGVTIPNQSGSSLTLAHVASADSAKYTVILKGGSNSVTNSGTLTVTTGVTATPLPNLLRYVGSIAVFKTTPSGTGPFIYTWKKNGTAINGQTGSSLTLINLTQADSGTYSAIVSGACGNPVTVTGTLMVDTCFPSVDVMLVIDRSGSMTGKPYFDALAACSNFVQNLHYTNGDQAGLASYNSSATLDQTLTNRLSKLDQSIDRIPDATGFTSVSLGLQAGQNELMSVRHQADSLPVLVLLSDGMPTGGDTSSNALYWAAQAKNDGTRIFTVGLGSVNAALLKGVASSTSDYYFTTNSAQLTALFNAVSTVICRPPTNIVVAGLANQVVCAGGTANFAVTATGCDSYRYQWLKDGVALNGKTNSVLTLNNVAGTDAGVYSVAVLSGCQNMTNSATLTVNASTVVTVPPANATNCPGSPVSFYVSATGTSLTYQWFKGASALPGQTNSTLTLNSISATDAGTYNAVISGVCGLPVTNSATLSVNSNAVVSVPPADTTVCVGGTANFAVNATGTGLTYQWYKGTALLNGKTGGTLTLNGVSAADVATYNVVVSGVCGNSVTNSAKLFVNANTVVVTPCVNATNCPGTTVNFSVNATGTGLTYQWFKGTTALGQTSSTLTLNNVSATDAGTYSVVVGGACGIAVTNSARLVINTNALIVTPPSSATNCPGTTANFSVNAMGTGLTYQWYKGTSLLNSQTTSVLTLANVTALDAGSYRVVVSGLCGAPVTNSATLTVNSNAVMTVPPSSSTNCPGTTASFSAGAGGTSLTFQWYKGAVLLPGQSGPVLTITNVTFADAGVYSVIAGGVCGIPATNSAVLVINTNALVTTPPSNATSCPGTTANFSVNAIGSGLMYQWYAGTNVLDNETNSLLTLTNVSVVDAGIYSIVVSGVCGVSLTNSATLTVNSNLLVTMPPADATNCPGTIASFSVNATGTGLTYQWYKETSLLPGETNSTLSFMLNNAGVTQGGLYRVVISGTCGALVTNSATLVVYANTVVLTPPVNATNCPGTTANFSTDARGNNLTYQWYQGATLLNGKTASVLVLNDVSAADAGIYRVVVGGSCGTLVTNSATLSINASAVITAPPANSTNCPGSTANFSVNATGTGLSYQWYRGTSIQINRTNSIFSLIDVGPKDAATYSVVVKGACGTPVTNSAVLIVNSNVVVTVPPSNATNCPGTTANFSVNANGTDLSYQWYKETALLKGQTGSTLTLSNVTSANAGSYRVIVSGDCGTPVTNNALLFINLATSITNSLSNSTNCPGTRAFFVVGANGTGLTFKWYKGASVLSNQTSPILELDNLTAADAGVYSIVISGACGTALTNSAMLVVNTNALIATPPANSTNCPGTTANFSVNAVGTGLTYQWYKGAALLNGRTTSVLTLANVSGNDGGAYSVVVSGLCGAPVTNSATLVVNQNVSVASLAGVTNNIGSSVTFTAVASGTGPFGYQWFKGGDALAGKTNSALTLANLQPGDNGTYGVSVTGACGQAATSAAVLTINLPPVVSITYPTNGAVFVEPATFTILAAASDPDGVVTNVEFFSSTNGVDFVFLGETNGSPYLTIASNLPAAHYTFMARATDNLGAIGVSAPVRVTVVPVEPPEVTVIGNLTLNTQDGFQWLTNVVCNPLYSHANALRIDIHNVTNSSIRVVNAAGTNNGVPFVISSGAIMPGTCWTNVIKFYDPLQLAFYPVLTVQLVDPVGVGEPDGIPQAIYSGKYLRDGTFLVEFTTVPGITYYIQYSSDMVHWKTVLPPFAGTGQRTQWIDSGPPGTESFPSINTTRFYRVLLAH